ncbi:MAG: hypothetical protein ABH842_02285 [Candidatus Micrarchaeota archaeon]
MKWLIILLPLLLCGCTEEIVFTPLDPAPAPLLNQPSVWSHYSNEIFSFDHPGNIVTTSQPGTLSGVHYLPSPYSYQPAESINLVYINTTEEYGENQDEIFKDNPTKFATDFLLDDIELDSMNTLLRADRIDSPTQFTVAQKYYVAESYFELTDFNTTYAGYAMSIYIPEKSIHVNIRVLALDSQIAFNIKEAILRSLRLE